MIHKSYDKKQRYVKGDVVLAEVWRIKDEVSASYGYDIDRMFDDLRLKQKTCGHPVVDFSKDRFKD
jgi:hypothetical protein